MEWWVELNIKFPPKLALKPLNIIEFKKRARYLGLGSILQALGAVSSHPPRAAHTSPFLRFPSSLA